MPSATANVLEHHGNSERTGLYVSPSFTTGEIPKLHRDTSFQAPILGPVYAQPLYVSNAVHGKDALIVATEQNVIEALDAADGSVLWQTSLGPPIPLAVQPCGDIDPLGITGTPVVDPASGTVFADAAVTPDAGITQEHFIFALDLATGLVKPGWPVSTSAVTFGQVAFDGRVQNQRGALAFMNGTVYVPYGGHSGDCGDYHGWVIGVSLAHPEHPTAWATDGQGGGAWAPGGISSDGTSLFISTGNTSGVQEWAGGEAVIRLGPGPVFSSENTDFFTPTDWLMLDAGDIDLGGSGPLLIQRPEGTPSEVAIALGKNGKAYVLDASNLGGISDGLSSAQVASGEIINAAATFPNSTGTFVIFNGNGAHCPTGQSGDLTSLRIGSESPPAIDTAWCAEQNGKGSPIVTTTDGTSQPIVWSVGSEGDNRLRAFDGLTGTVLFTSDPLPLTRRFVTPIVAKGRVFVGTDSQLVAFTLQ